MRTTFESCKRLCRSGTDSLGHRSAHLPSCLPRVWGKRAGHTITPGAPARAHRGWRKACRAGAQLKESSRSKELPANSAPYWESFPRVHSSQPLSTLHEMAFLVAKMHDFLCVWVGIRFCTWFGTWAPSVKAVLRAKLRSSWLRPLREQLW